MMPTSEKSIPYHSTVMFFVSLLQLTLMIFLLLGLSLWSTKTPADVYGRVELLDRTMAVHAAEIESRIDALQDLEARRSTNAAEAAVQLQALRIEVRRMDIEGTKAYISEKLGDRWHKADDIDWQRRFLEANPELNPPKPPAVKESVESD